MQPQQQPATLPAIESHMTMERLDVRDLGRQWIAVTLSFDPADPWAVTLTLYSGPAPVRWTFGRELVVEGLHEPVGEGDVLVWPSLDDAGRSSVAIELRSPEGTFAGQLPTREVAPFVRDMLAAVPAGSETAHLDIEALVDLMVHPDGGQRP